MARTPTKLLALFVALFVAIALALWWLGGEPEVERAAARAQSEPSDAGTARSEQVTLEMPAASERVERDAAARQGMAVFLVGNVRTSKGEPAQVDLVLIRSREPLLSDPARERPREFEVRDVTGQRKQPVSYVNGRVARTREDGSYRIDITEHVAAQLAAGAARLDLSIKVLRTGENPREFDVSMELLDTWREARAPVELRADLVLRSSGRVHGRVVGRQPLEHDAWVALFELYEGVALRRQPLAHARCDSASGAFEFLVADDLEVALVAWSAGMRPRTERVRVSENSAPLELLLDDGERVAGMVKLGPAGVACGLDFELVSRDFIACPVGEDVLAWNGSVFEWSRAYAQSDERGVFELSSLAPGSYRAHIRASRGVRVSATSIEVVAPAHDLLLELPLARVELLLFRDGTPAANFSFGVNEQRQRGVMLDQQRTDANGVAELWLAEDSEVWVNDPAKAPNLPQRGVRIENPGPGRSTTQRIDL